MCSWLLARIPVKNSNSVTDSFTEAHHIACRKNVIVVSIYLCTFNLCVVGAAVTFILSYFVIKTHAILLRQNFVSDLRLNYI